MQSRSLGHRAPLLWLVLPLAGGLVLAKTLGSQSAAGPLAVGAGASLVALAAAAYSMTRSNHPDEARTDHGGPRLVWASGLVVALLCAGLASYALHRARLASWEQLPSREAGLTLKIERVFVQADPKRITGLAVVRNAANPFRDLTGQRLYFSLTLGKGEAPPLRSGVVSALGVLSVLPLDPPANSFDAYLAGAGANFRFSRGKIVREEQPPLGYYRFCAAAANWFHEILGVGIASKRPRLAGLLRAMMLGSTHELSTEQHELFMQSGTMHLFAISGLNIGVIASALQTLLLLLRLPAWARFAIGAALLWLFVDITGASPSAVRAFAMAVFAHAAFVLHRPNNLLAALLASALCVLLVAPLQLFSASFLMSYAIVIALIVLGLPLGESWANHWSPWRHLPKPAWQWWHHLIDLVWRSASSAVAIGLATTLVSLLTGVQFFQLLTPGSLAANLLLIPAAVVVTLGGFASLLFGMLHLTAGSIVCNHAAALVLLLIEWLVRISVKIPGAFGHARFDPPWIGGVALLTLIALLLAGYGAHWRPRGSGWVPFAFVALVLIFGVEFAPQ